MRIVHQSSITTYPVWVAVSLEFVLESTEEEAGETWAGHMHYESFTDASSLSSKFVDWRRTLMQKREERTDCTV